MKQTPLTLHRFTRVEFDRLVDLGMFQGEPVELIGGLLVVAEPQGRYHASAVGAVGDGLRTILPPGWLVRVQMPVALDDQSEPEPDVAVVPGAWTDYHSDHPARAALVVEIAETSLAFDRGEKASLYARGRVRDYWIVNTNGIPGWRVASAAPSMSGRPRSLSTTSTASRPSTVSAASAESTATTE
jgi:Uma2 family endonuclease